MNNTKRKLSISLVTLLVTLCMLLGSTYAWFTDSVSNTGNRIQAGTLDIDLLMDKTLDGNYVSIDKGTGDIFKEAAKAQNSNETLWEPGKTQVALLAVENKGNLALKYNAYIDVTDEGLVGSLEYLFLPLSTDDYKDAFGSKTTWSALKTAAEEYDIAPADVVAGRNIITTGVLDEIYESNEQNEKDYVALVVHMKEEAGNEYQNKDVIIDITIVATQATAEEDGFGSNQYDATALGNVPNFIRKEGKGTIAKNADTKATIIIQDNTTSPTVNAIIPESSEEVKFTDYSDNVHTVDNSTKDIVLSLNVVAKDVKSDSITYDISMKNDTDDYQVKSSNKIITIKLNIGKGFKNVSVEHSGTLMTEDSTNTGTDQTFNYNSSTGILTIYTSSFSPFKVDYEYEAEVSITKSGEETIYTTLGQFRDSVNAGNSYAGYTITLLNDVDLKNNKWTPIGTSENPFKGVFNGNNKTISNILVAENENAGFFGYINGNTNAEYLTTSDIWDFTNNVLIEEKIKESKYTAVVKDLKLTNVSITITTSGKKHAGALAAISDNAYINNVEVTRGTVNGYKVVGGLIGGAYGCVINNCNVSGDVTVTAANYHAAGIVGASNTANSDYRIAILNCVNNAKIISHGNGSGYAGGIIGDANNGKRKAFVVYNCLNNGIIQASGEHVGGIVGNVSVQAGESVPVIANCTNNGSISSNVGETLKNVGGICSNAAGLIFSCTNFGSISGNVTVSAAGIVGSTYQTTVTLNNSVNFGNLSGVTGVVPSDAVSGVQNQVILENLTYANVEALQTAIEVSKGSVVLKNLTVTDKTGTLVLPSDVFNVVADKQYFAGLDISNCDRDYITITIPNFVYTLHGDASSKTLGLNGANNKTIFAADCKLDWLRNYGSHGTYVKVNGCVVNTIHGATVE